MTKKLSVTQTMINFSRKMKRRRIKPRETVARDRSLNGKARIRARKEQNRGSRR